MMDDYNNMSLASINQTMAYYNKLKMANLPYISLSLITAAISCIDNFIICVLIVERKKLHQLCHFLFLNVAFSSMLTSAYYVVNRLLQLNFTRLYNVQTMTSNISANACYALHFVLYFSLTSAFLTLAIISFERYKTLKNKPLKEFLKSNIFMLLLAIWLPSIAASIPVASRYYPVDNLSSQAICSLSKTIHSLVYLGVYGFISTLTPSLFVGFTSKHFFTKLVYGYGRSASYTVNKVHKKMTKQQNQAHIDVEIAQDHNTESIIIDKRELITIIFMQIIWLACMLYFILVKMLTFAADLLSQAHYLGYQNLFIISKMQNLFIRSSDMLLICCCMSNAILYCIKIEAINSSISLIVLRLLYKIIRGILTVMIYSFRPS